MKLLYVAGGIRVVGGEREWRRVAAWCSRSTSGCLVLRGRGAAGATPSDTSKSEDRERLVLPCDPIHGGLEWHAARRRVPLLWQMRQVLRDLMSQRAPDARTGFASLRALCSQFEWRQFVCFDVFVVINMFRGINYSGHGNTPWLRMLPISHGGCLLRSSQYGRHWCGVGEGQSSTSSLTYNM